MYRGYDGDVNNTIGFSDVYAPAADFPYDIGRPDSTATQTAPNNDTPSTGAQNGTIAAANPALGKPGHWFVTFALVFVGFIFVARKFGGAGQQYSNIRMSAYNGLFLTFFIVLMLNLMKVLAARVPPNPVSALILAA